MNISLKMYYTDYESYHGEKCCVIVKFSPLIGKLLIMNTLILIGRCFFY
jgi:hypothetical protein